MNWLKNFVRPKLRKLVGRGKDSPDELWHNCQNCQQRVFRRDLEKNLNVCPHCGFHLRVDARLRMAMLFDDGQYQLVDLPQTAVDPLRFRDRRRYTDRLKEAKDQSGAADALRVATGSMGGVGVVIAVLDFQFMGGSMGQAVGEGILAAVRLALQRKSPVIVVSSSGGARMQEGIYSLMQMARTAIAVEELREAGLPYVVVLADPTTGGVTASFAMLGDIAVAEPGAVIGFAGQRVIEQTIRETLPEGFQRAEYLYDHGMVDMVVHRAELRQTLIRVLSLLTQRGAAASPARPMLDADGNAPALGYKGP